MLPKNNLKSKSDEIQRRLPPIPGNREYAGIINLTSLTPRHRRGPLTPEYKKIRKLNDFLNIGISEEQQREVTLDVLFLLLKKLYQFKAPEEDIQTLIGMINKVSKKPMLEIYLGKKRRSAEERELFSKFLKDKEDTKRIAHWTNVLKKSQKEDNSDLDPNMNTDGKQETL